MADTVNHGAASPSAAATPAVAPTSQPPAQPSSTHQPAATSNYYGQHPQAYGQAYQPYQPYQQYGQPQAAYQPYFGAPAGTYGYPQGSPIPAVPETKFWMFTKTFLHGACLIFGIIGLGLGLAFVSSSSYGYMAAIACPVPGLALLWNGSELIVRAVHKFQSGVHPGATVGCCLILWLVATIVGVLESLYATYPESYCEYDYYYSSSDSDSSSRPSDCRPEFAKIWIAVTVFTLLLAAAEFTLFVMACIDTSKRNASKKIVMVVNPAYWGQAAQGWQPMPQDNAQQPVAVTEPAMARGGNGQDVPLQDRSPTPGTPYATPAEAPVVDEKGKGPAQHEHGVSEYYGRAN